VTAALIALALLAPAADAPPARMLLTADEWMLLSSRQRVKAGRVQVQLYNRGEDAHDVAARRINRLGQGVGRTKRLRETRPGELGEATWRLRPGRYRLWCTLPAHEALGMRASLRVRRR
jgi:plastocyanin